jgi:hypothetical protein
MLGGLHWLCCHGHPKSPFKWILFWGQCSKPFFYLKQ